MLQKYESPIIDSLKSLDGWDISKARQEFQFFTLLANSGARQGNNLLKCSPESVVQSILSLVHLNLSLNPAKKQAYLIAYGQTCTLSVSYQGQIDYLAENGVISHAVLGAVRKNDKFAFERSEKGIKWHHVKMTPRGELIGAYCIYKLRGGHEVGDFFDMEDINKRRSRAKTDTFWKNWPDEMAMNKAARMARRGLPNHSAINTLDQIENQHYDLEPKQVDAERLSTISDVFGKCTTKLKLLGAYNFLPKYEQEHPKVMEAYDRAEMSLRDKVIN